jgi:hypothetical protein
VLALSGSVTGISEHRHVQLSTSEGLCSLQLIRLASDRQYITFLRKRMCGHSSPLVATATWRRGNAENKGLRCACYFLSIYKWLPVFPSFTNEDAIN